MKILKFTLIVFVVFCINEFKAQSISGSWYSEKNNICIKFDSIDNSVVINEFFDPNVDSGKSITYKKKLIWVYLQVLALYIYLYISISIYIYIYLYIYIYIYIYIYLYIYAPHIAK